MTISELKQVLENLYDYFIDDVYANKDFKQITIFGSGGNDE